MTDSLNKNNTNDYKVPNYPTIYDTYTSKDYSLPTHAMPSSNSAYASPVSTYNYNSYTSDYDKKAVDPIPSYTSSYSNFVPQDLNFYSSNPYVQGNIQSNQKIAQQS